MLLSSPRGGPLEVRFCIPRGRRIRARAAEDEVMLALLDLHQGELLKAETLSRLGGTACVRDDGEFGEDISLGVLNWFGPRKKR